MNNFQIGDILWYETGLYTASKARVIHVEGYGATKVYVVHFIDHSPEQSDGSDANTHHYPSGGIGVSWRKCKAIDYIGSHK